MKSTFDNRKTIGSMIVDTHEKHQKSDPIECGDFIREFGKKYVSNLFDYIEYGSKHADRFYINILSRKTNLYMQRAIEIFPYISIELPLMQQNQDVWFVDCERQKIELLWSLPDEGEFDIILADPSKDNEKLINWINIYKDLKRKACKAALH